MFDCNFHFPAYPNRKLQHKIYDIFWTWLLNQRNQEDILDGFFLEFKTVINSVGYRNMRYEYFETRDKEIRHDRKDRRTQGIQDIRQPYA